MLKKPVISKDVVQIHRRLDFDKGPHPLLRTDGKIGTKT